MAQVAPRSTVHDVVIIGSGAGGGTVTKVLADLGVRVLLMEAGPMVTMDDFKTLDSPLNDWHRGAGDAATLYTTGQGAPLPQRRTRPSNQSDEPYTVAPGSQFRWSRSRVIGGRTNHYGRIQLRYSDYDFKNKSMLGVGFDWPIAYSDLAPYYDKAERFIGVTGTPRRTAQRARRHLPDAGAVAAARTSHRPGVREAGHQGDELAPGGDHQPLERTSGLHLLRQLRPRLHLPIELRLQLRADFPGDGDRTRDRAGQRDGARARHRRVGQGHGRVVHRQGDGRGAPGAVPDRCPVGRVGRVGAAAAQLEVGAPPARGRKFGRHGRQVPHRYRRLRVVRHRAVHARACRRSRPPATAPTSTSRGGRPIATTSSTSRWAITSNWAATGSPSRGWDSAPGLRAEPGVRPADEAGDSRHVRAERGSISPAAARWCRTRTATARSIPTRRTSGAFRSCASTGNGATTSATRRATCATASRR